jgi:hypothetical protein
LWKDNLPKLFIVGLVTLALALSSSGVLAQGEGVIEAQVVNGTEGGGSVEGLTVTLYAFQNMVELDSLTAVTNAEGQVRFEELETSPDIVYVLSVTYAGIEYGSLPLDFTGGDETTLVVSLQVYETTESFEQAAIQVERMHVFVDLEDGVMSVGELHIFSNSSDRTFIGTEHPELDQRVTLRFVLPEGATELHFQMSGEDDRYVVTKDGFADTEAVRPGTSQQVLYGYNLSYGQADSFDFVRSLLYPTTNLNVLVPRMGVDVTSDQVELNEIRTVEGQAYLNLNGRNLAAGDELSVHFEGLQDIVHQATATGATQNEFDPKWIALGLAALALVGGIIYPSLRRSRTPVPASAPIEPTDVRLTRLLQAIADLDDAFEAGRVDEAGYRQQRRALKDEALTLMQES